LQGRPRRRRCGWSAAARTVRESAKDELEAAMERRDPDPNHPDQEPAAAELRREEEPGPSAPDGPAPDLDEIQPGDGPGQSPGE
jgi:hypothetical protein